MSVQLYTLESSLDLRYYEGQSLIVDQVLISDKKLKPKSVEIPNEIVQLSMTTYESQESIFGAFETKKKYIHNFLHVEKVISSPLDRSDEPSLVVRF